MQSQKISDLFVGRTEEIALFEKWLADDQSPISLLYLHDEAKEPEKKGGIGKTWLLQEFARRARASRHDLAIVTIDFFNVVDRDRIVIAKRIAQVLSETFPGWQPEFFEKALYGHVGDGLAREVYIDSKRDALFDALAADLQRLEQHLAGRGTYLLLLFDTFEMIEENPVIAVLGSSGTFPDTYRSRRVRSVVAGRNALDWSRPNWLRRGGEIREIALTPFDLQEMLDYLDARLLRDQPDLQEKKQTLYEWTFGRPILIGLVTDVLNHRIMSLEQLLTAPPERFEERLVAQINRLEDPLNWVILFMGHVYHQFNMEMLDWIIHKTHIKDTENINYAQLIQQLPDLSFVRRSGAGEHFVLHDVMRRLVTRYCCEIQDRDRAIRKEISRCIVDYCEQQSQVEARSQLSTIMKLYHLLFSNLDEGHAYFQTVLQEAAVRHLQSAFARSLLQETRPFAAEFSASQTSAQIFAGALVLWSEENTKEALNEHERLAREASPEWYSEREVEILIAKGRCYLDLSELSSASICFMQALELSKTRGDHSRLAFLLDLLGLVHRRRGELDSAMNYYNEGKEIARVSGNLVQYANTLNNLSNVLRLKGNIEEALRTCKYALKLRKKLVQEHKASEKAVVLSLNTLGLIYIDSGDYVQAEQNLREAIDASTHARDTRNIAMGKLRLGRVHFAREEYDQAQIFFEEARKLSEGAYPEVLLASLTRLGRIHLRNERSQEALFFFQHALETAERSHDYYQRVECLIDYATALEDLKRAAEANAMWQEVQEISTRENYHYLRFRAEQARGDLDMIASDYRSAFQHYALSCQFAVKHNQHRYSSAVRTVTDKLLDIPTDSAPPIITSLITFWTELGYATIHPELIDSCKEMQQMMGV